MCQTIPQFLSVARLTTAFHALGVLAYGDYSDLPAVPVVSFSGWHTRVRDISPFAAALRPQGGGDYPEAAKTAVVELLKVVSRPTVVVWYADAPPHARSPLEGNGVSEQRALGGGDDFDWVKLCRRLADARVTVCPVVSGMAGHGERYFAVAAALTGGACVLVPDTQAPTITRATISLMVSLEESGGRPICSFSSPPPPSSLSWVPSTTPAPRPASPLRLMAVARSRRLPPRPPPRASSPAPAGAPPGLSRSSAGRRSASRRCPPS